MNAIHTRAKAYRNIYRAVPVSKQDDTKETISEYFEETKAMVDKAHAEFWKKRGHRKPPHVSDCKFLVFDLPSDGIKA